MTPVGNPNLQNRFLTEVSWSGYEHILEALEERHIRVTYDRGQLEIMTLSPEHEQRKTLLRQLLELALLERGLDYRGGRGVALYPRS